MKNSKRQRWPREHRQLATGSPHIGLEFCGRHFEFLIRARSLLVRGLEPRSYKSGTRKFSEDPIAHRK